MNDDRLKKIDEDAAEVAKRALMADAAHDSERSAAAHLLELAIHMLTKYPEGPRGALRAIGTTPIVAWTDLGDGSPKSKFGYDRVIVLGGPDTPVPRGLSHEISGHYTDKALWLTERAELQRVTFAGDWMRDRVGNVLLTSRWATTIERIVALDAIAQFDVAECIARISVKLDAYLRGNATRRTEIAERRAAKLRAVVTLLGEEKRR